MRTPTLCTLFALMLGTAPGCAHSRNPLAATASPLALSRVVLYRNGVGYFERHGVVNGDRLTLKVRKDQVNDLLKSLTVIDQSSGKALSVSIPLDPQMWQDAAIAMLMPGQGKLAQVLDGLRGTLVTVETDSRTMKGRVVMVERIAMAADAGGGRARVPTPAPVEDHKLTLLDGDALQIVMMSDIRTISLKDGDLVMQLGRHLDATAGEGMFQQVDVVVRLSERGKHDLAVSYVAAAPLWKPTYRLVLGDADSGQALLQAWAVVSNVSGENWDRVSLGLTSGAPLAFRYDLHTPEGVDRPDLTRSGVHKHAEVAFGESSYGAPDSDIQEMGEEDASGYPESSAGAPDTGTSVPRGKSLRAKSSRGRAMQAPPAPPSVDMATLARSAAVRATTKRVAGLTRFDITERVTIPDGSATMVVLVNQRVAGEETFLYKPGGSGQGYEHNPYRVVRFSNDTDFVLEPGPISIYAGGSFVGEGLSEAIASRGVATIPFAAEPSILVQSLAEHSGDEMRITRIVRGVMEVEAFRRLKTTWTVQGNATDAGFRVLVRQSRAGPGYTLVDPPKGTETLQDGYYIPVVVAPGKTKATLSVLEQTPSRVSLTIWDDKVPGLLQRLLQMPTVDASQRALLEPIVQARQTIGRIDTELEGLNAQQAELDERAQEQRANLKAIQKDPRAGALRQRLSRKLEEISRYGDEIGREIVELSSQRMERKIELEDQLRDLNLTPKTK